MPIETTPFDAAGHLRTPEEQAIFLADALETGDAGFIAHALGILARARGMTEVARGAGVTREALYRSLGQEGDPRLTTLLGVMRALGLKLSVTPG
jgi:probable addiction module antidote protein